MDLASDSEKMPSPTVPPAPPAVEEGDDKLGALKRLLKVETERLRTRHRLGLGGREIAAGRSDLVDMVVKRACQLAAAEFTPLLAGDDLQVAVVALGGYGRRELAPCSDVDLLFLRADRADEDIRALVEHALALLWDAGLTVGHSFRTVGECVAMARDDLHSRTAICEARLLAGSAALFARLIEQTDTDVFASARATEAFLGSLRADLAERYARYGSAVGHLEPQVKEGAGGLRDMHVVLWVAHARFGTRGLAALHEQGRITDRERKAILRAYDYLYRVRNEAHFTTGRKSDLLTLDLQPAVAASLGYRDRRGVLASEAFMRDYYEHASDLHRFTHGFLVRHAPAPPPRRRFGLALLRRRPRGPFEIRDGKLHSRAKDGPPGPRRLLEAFAIAQNEGAELSEELKLETREGLRGIDRAFRNSRESGRAFMRFLEHKGRVGPALRAMHETGLLGRLVPEFERLTFLVQHDYYHRYTVDEHTLTAIDALDQVASGGDPSLERFRKVLDQVEQPSTLYLGMLLHDIGKGHGSGHVRRGTRIAERVCPRLWLDAERTADVRFLVDAHLEMSQISQRRDLSEPGLVEAFARRVSTLDRLNTLFLLTYADHCAVGPGIWNEWKGTLLWDLYNRTRARLTKGTAAEDEEPDAAWEKAARELENEFKGSEVERHFALMPERYLRSTKGPDMARHFRLVRGLEEHALVAEWRSDAHVSELVVAARDHRGLFAQLAGTLTARGLDILSVDLYTREDGVALDVFKVREAREHSAVPAGRRSAIESALRAAVEGDTDVAAGVEKWRRGWRRRSKRPLMRPAVRFDSTASAESSVVEVRAEDEPGLAYRIASVLSAHGLNIGFAKIATEKSHALDVFYVTDAAGAKLEGEEMLRLEAALAAALDPREGRQP